MSKELKALAEAATQGPWVQWVENAAVYAGKPEVNRKGAILPGKGERIARICEGDLFDPTEQELADHAYIAAANPAVILQLLAERDALLAERDALQAFANEIVSGAFEGGSFYGGDIQDIGVKHGLLRIEQRDDECGEPCACREYGFPSECYRKTELLGFAALQGAQP